MSSGSTGPGHNLKTVSGAEAVVTLLRDLGVEVIFGLCGDTSLPLYDALYRGGGAIRHVLTRDERHAGYMADGYARVTGRAGVCEGPSGGGATYIAPALIEANESSIPILALTSDISVSGRGRFTLTELDQSAFMRPLTKWNHVLDTPEEIGRTFRAAARAMVGGRPGAVHIGLPLDVQRGEVDRSDLWVHRGHGHPLAYPQHRAAPEPEAVERAARLLDEAQWPVIVCGGGVVIAGAEAELAALARALDAPVATTVSGQGSIADGDSLAVGVVGSNGGTAETREIVDAADTLVFVGCRAGSVTTERWRHPRPGGARIVHVDADPRVPGTNYDADATIVADARLALAALADAVTPGSDGRGAVARVAEARKRKFDAFAALARSAERPIRPERLVATLQEVLPDDALVVADPGTPCPYLSAYYRWPRAGRHFITNRAHGALGYALAAAMGAHVGRPGVPCVAVMGDGSFGMAAGELETLRRLAMPIVVIVVSNSVFGWIKAGQKSGFGARYYSVDFGETDHAAVGRAFGLRSWRVEDPEALSGVLRAALDAGEPVVVDVVCQPLQEARAPVSEWIA